MMASFDGLPSKTDDYLANLSRPGGSEGQSYLDQVDQVGKGVADGADTPTEQYLNNLTSGPASGAASKTSVSYLDSIASGSSSTSSSTATTSSGGSGTVPPQSTEADESEPYTGPKSDVEPAQIEAAKEALFKACIGTNRGFACRREERSTIQKIIKDLEVMNPNPSPNDGFEDGTSLLAGEWQLLFTDALDVLSLALLPGVSIGQIYQNIGTDGTEISNIVELQPLLASLLPSTVAQLHVRAESSVSSPVRLNLKFASAAFEPQTFLGRQVAEKLKPLVVNFPKKARNVGWLDHTFLDKDIRIARALGGSAFVLIRVKEPQQV